MKEAGNNSYQSILVDKEACIGCINCIKRCPTKAIRVMDGKAQIDSSKCINCGDCVMVCQKRAMHPNFDGIDVINNFKYKVALPASSFFGQFRNADDVDKILNSLLYIGFDDVFEAARGDDILSGIVKKALAEGKLAKPLISAACPACVELILMCFHNLKNNLVPFVPASHIAAKLAREEAVRKTGLAAEDIGVFFISPCPAHASAIKTDLYKSGCKIDGVLSVREVSLKVMNLKFDGVEVKLDPNNNEIMCRGHNVMIGYYKAPELTAQAIDKDGWFHTGDTGKFDEYGRLTITGRIKSIFKTSMGKYINPFLIEEKFLQSPFIDCMMVVGENQKFAAALIVPNFEFLKSWCGKHGVEYTTKAETLQNDIVKARFVKEVNKYNAFFGDTEKIRRFELIPEEWTPKDGILTPTLKVKRSVAIEKYRDVIDKMFA